MIDKATVKKILDAADIVEVVGDYVSLTKRGANYMGLCPFHNERTPSFSVSPARGICHCFSCGKGGSPVNFIMEKEGINFHDALLHLAKKYGIKVEERQLTDEERAELRRSNWQMISGLADFAGVILGTAAILLLVALLVSLLNWLVNDLNQSFTLLQKNF